MDYAAIKTVIDNYRKSGIQSEAEVSAKLIHPLLNALGYPDDLIALEFPVYGYAGRDALNAKDADFIVFQDKEFAKHRKRTQANIKWVQMNSLIIVEAKKPGKIPNDDLGQAQFYSAWTKSLAYVVTDGELFRAFFRNELNADLNIIDTTIEELPSISALENLEFDCLFKIKANSHLEVEEKLLNINEEEVCIISDDKDIVLPEETMSYIRACLGKNADGLTNVQTLSKYFNTTDCYLANNIRYGIPEYMINIPRGFYNAYIYLDNSIFPFVSGTIAEFYCNEEARYHFESDYIEVVIRLVSDQIISYEIGYHILDETVNERLSGFKLVKQIFDSKRISIQVDNTDKIRINLPNANNKNMWTSREFVLGMFNFWYEGMQKLKDIEEYYDVKFKLRQVSDEEELNRLYESIDKVHDGIKLQENCFITVPAESVSEDIEIEYPTLFEENDKIPLEKRVIQGIVFKPFRSTLLPCKIEKDKQGILKIPACCEYIVESNMSKIER